MLSKYVDTSEFSSLHYLGLILICLLIFTIIFKDSVPKLDLAETFKFKKTRENYKNMSYAGAEPSDFSDKVNDANDLLIEELSFSKKGADDKTYDSHYQEITKRMSSWANMVAYKAVLEGAIDPKEMDITSPGFDKNMRNIEKINKVIDFATFLKEKEK